jgi:hypothetical protein
MREVETTCFPLLLTMLFMSVPLHILAALHDLMVWRWCLESCPVAELASDVIKYNIICWSMGTYQPFALAESCGSMCQSLLLCRHAEVSETDYHNVADLALDQLQEKLEVFIEDLDIDGGDVEQAVRQTKHISNHTLSALKWGGREQESTTLQLKELPDLSSRCTAYLSSFATALYSCIHVCRYGIFLVMRKVFCRSLTNS